MHFWLVTVVDVLLQLVAPRVFPEGERVAAQLCVFDIEIEYVEPKPVHPAVEPEAHLTEDRFLHLGIAPIEVGLLYAEGVQVVLPRDGVPLPRPSPERTHPVVRRPALPGVAPNIPVSALALPRGTRLDKPGVLVGGVVHHQVHQDTNPLVMCLFQEAIEIFKGAEDWIDRAVVADVVTCVLVRGGEDRRKPDCVDAEVRKIVEPVFDARQVAHAITV